MACPYIRLEIAASHPDGIYVCDPPGGERGPYTPLVRELREWCLTTDGNPLCAHRPGGNKDDQLLAS